MKLLMFYDNMVYSGFHCPKNLITLLCVFVWNLFWFSDNRAYYGFQNPKTLLDEFVVWLSSSNKEEIKFKIWFVFNIAFGVF